MIRRFIAALEAAWKALEPDITKEEEEEFNRYQP